MGRIRGGALVVAALTGVASSVTGQSPPASAIDSAEPFITRWIELVWRGSSDQAWVEASTWFQARIGRFEWNRWVETQRVRQRGLGGPPRLIGTNYVRDEPPLQPVEWVDMTFAVDLPAGGRFLQRVWVARPEGETDWYVANYGVSVDPQAMVANAAIDPIPYLGFGAWHHRHGFIGIVRPRPGASRPAPEPPRAVANPATFRKRPPLQ